jgi:Lrp/AsnC family leucine-responsive transcriptional regulator
MEVKLDLKDRKILYELDKNSRQSFGKIAKTVGLSKNAVIYRVNYLKQTGAIKHFHAWVDFGRLGYIEFRIYLNLRNVTPKKEDDIIDFLCKKKIVTYVGSMEGKYNVVAKIVTKNIYEMHALWDELFNKYMSYIEERLMTIVGSSNYYYKAYLPGLAKSTLKEGVVQAINPEKVDDADFKILEMLAKDARTPVFEMAAKLKLTPKTIIGRMRNLEKRKIIVGYGTVIDLSKIGYQNFRVSFILFRLTAERMKSIKDYAHKNPYIVYDEEAMGGDDYEIEVQVKDIYHLREIIKELKNKFADIIEDYRVLHVFEEHKHLGFME